MTRKFLAGVSAAALSLSLLAGPVFSQVQLAQEVIDKLTALGLDVTGVVFTEEDVLQLENVLNSTDDDPTKKAEIEKIMAE